MQVLKDDEVAPALAKRFILASLGALLLIGRNKRPHLAGYPTRARRCMHTLLKSLFPLRVAGAAVSREQPGTAASKRGPIQRTFASQASSFAISSPLNVITHKKIAKPKRAQNTCGIPRTRADNRWKNRKGSRNPHFARMFQTKAAILFRIVPPQNTFGCTLNRTKYRKKGS